MGGRSGSSSYRCLSFSPHLGPSCAAAGLDREKSAIAMGRTRRMNGEYIYCVLAANIVGSWAKAVGMGNNRQEVQELLKRSDVFAGLDQAQLGRMIELGELRTFPEGETIVQEDRQGTSCFFLVSGRVDIEIQAAFAGRTPQKLATLKRGEMFGELSLVDGFLRSATARAAEPVEVLVFENEKVEALMAEDPAIGFRIMRNMANVLSSRIRSTNMKLRNALSDIFYY